MSGSHVPEIQEKKWYVVQVATGCEKVFEEELKRRILRANLEEKFGDVLVPTEEVVEMRSGQRRKTKRKFFPGYVFVQMSMDDLTWHFVQKIPHFRRFIGGTGQNPPPLSEAEALAIMQQMQEGVSKPKPKVLFEPGEVVRVIEGPFADFNGVVEEVNYEKNRLRVAVLIFGRSTPVELEFNQVEKA